MRFCYNALSSNEGLAESALLCRLIRYEIRHRETDRSKFRTLAQNVGPDLGPNFL